MERQSVKSHLRWFMKSCSEATIVRVSKSMSEEKAQSSEEFLGFSEISVASEPVYA
jgi:hypothetical protein